MDEWSTTWNDYIKPHLEPASKLRLNLIYDVADFASGQKVVQPLLEPGHPKLAGCSIRLRGKRDSDLEKLAVETVGAVTRHSQAPPSQRSFKSFMKLPSEIRLRILECTDLITPYGEVQWDPWLGK